MGTFLSTIILLLVAQSVQYLSGALFLSITTYPPHAQSTPAWCWSTLPS